MNLFAIATNPQTRVINVDLLGEPSVDLTPEDARDLIALLALSLKSLESFAPEATCDYHDADSNQPSAEQLRLG